MPTNQKPLWQQLNEQRTPGEWTVINGNEFFPTVVMNKVDVPKKDIGTLYYPHPHFVINASHDQKMISINANANYIALSVNNLHILAEALKNFILISEQRSEFHSPFEAATLLQAKEALNRIS